MLTGIAVFLLCVLLTSAVARSQRESGDRRIEVPLNSDPDTLAHHALKDRPPVSATEVENGRHHRDAVAYQDAMPSAYLDTSPNRLINAAALATVFDIIDEGKRPVRIYHIGDSHVAGRSFPVAVRDELESAWGTAGHPYRGAGVEFRYAGRNGAQSFHLVSQGYLDDVRDFEPDLLIVSLGTNEAHGSNYSEEQHRQQLANFVAEVRHCCPRAVILMTTPPGDYLRRRPNPAIPRCVNLIVDYCAAQGLVCWNLWQICGGEAALDNYRRLLHQRPDGIHFSPEGYTVQGRLLAQAILAAYNE